MKKITLILASFIFATTAINASETNYFSDLNSGSNLKFNHDEPFQFIERGIEFFVFPNGEFDFNTRPNENVGDYYFKTAGRRSEKVNQNQFENFGVRIEQDNFGRIRRIGNTFINYDFQDRVSRIGSIFMQYNRFSLTQIGGLQLVYNRFGELINTFGSIKCTRNYGFVNQNYSYYGNGNQHNNSNYYNNNYDQSNDNQQNANDHYYYKNDGTKEKVENRDTNSSEIKSENRR